MANEGTRERLRKRLEAIPKAVREAVGPSLLAAADDMADAMRHLAPRDTGALIESIEVTGPGESTPAYSQPGGAHVVPENAAAITAGNTAVRYAHLVEYGTTSAPAQAFFWPAYRLYRAKVKRKIGRAISKAVKSTKGE
ncbi:HK97-gp10 family putative phage morphogenesis protein [Rhodoplanes roseus]|uniref:HK97 gp10 family phage protein n=1 Tax=Rhodoplanes roseus TaxID=29409 RepID=A0A327L3B6_9BRAD|nr:HK97-gp10 family putative phage morphogenesis protein [Rhodoplanes roseus]RAI43982.1 hypothetical protein CH341_11430 [Rhodoplanes roseus]